MHRFASSATKTERDLYQSLSVAIFNNLMHQRLSDLTKQADPPFQSASLQIGSAFEGIGSATIRCVTTPGKHERGLQALYTELHRVRTHGFTDTEIERLKAAILQNQQNAYDRRDEIP